MKTVVLPNHLTNNDPEPVIVFDYNTSKELSKQEVQLNYHTFSFLQSGYKEVFFDNSTFAIKDNSFLLMKSGNCLMTEKLSDTHKNYHSILLFFDNLVLNNFIQKYSFNFKNSTSSPSTYSFRYDNFIQRYVESLQDIIQLSTTLQKRILPTKLEEIMLYLLDTQGTDFLSSLTNQHDDKTLLFKQTIQKYQYAKLTLKELAFLTNLSESSFKREFQKHFQMSPMKWFQQKRLDRAAYLLKNNHRPSEIFEQVGYENLSNFIAAFKTKFGVTPKQFESNI